MTIWLVIGHFRTTDGDEFVDVMSVHRTEALAEQSVAEEKAHYPVGNIASADFDIEDREMDE